MSAILQKHSRMPRKYNRARAALAETKPKQIAHKYRLEDVTPQTILTRYLTDESTQTIADDYGVTRQALSAHLIKHAEEDWKDVQMARALARKDKAEEAMDGAEDALQLAKAREMLKSAQWDLERVCKRIYGIDRGEFNINFNLGDLGDRLRRAKERAEKFITPAIEQTTQVITEQKKNVSEPVCHAHAQDNLAPSPSDTAQDA